MKRLMDSRMRKVMCRMFGDKTGGVMMEYVILAVLIAAAVVVAVAMFGKTLVGMFGVAATSAPGLRACRWLLYAATCWSWRMGGGCRCWP